MMWRPHPSTEPLDARLLIEKMSNLSENHYCAGWYTGTEFMLWSMLEGGSRQWGFGEVSQRDVDDLTTLSKRAGGWIVWDGGQHKDHDGNRLVDFDEWRRLFSAWAERSQSPEA